MKRGEFIAGLSAIVLSPLGVRGQSPKKLPRISWLSTGPPVPRMIDAFRQGLGELGYVEGANVGLEYRQSPTWFGAPRFMSTGS
jgi:putative tryptophan/tyrosine transport system substrate-binding protein